jgi:hypothetical protein
MFVYSIPFYILSENFSKLFIGSLIGLFLNDLLPLALSQNLSSKKNFGEGLRGGG